MLYTQIPVNGSSQLLMSMMEYVSDRLTHSTINYVSEALGKPLRLARLTTIKTMNHQH